MPATFSVAPGLEPLESLGGRIMARLFLSTQASVYAMAGYEGARGVEGAIVSGVDTGNRVNRALLGGIDHRFTERVSSAIAYTFKESGFRTGGSANNSRILWSRKYFF